MLIIFSLFLMLCLLSCNDINNTEASSNTSISTDENNVLNNNNNTSSNTNTVIDAEGSNDINNSKNDDENVDDVKQSSPYEKYGNNVYFTFSENKATYYANVVNIKEPSASSDEKLEEYYEQSILAPNDIPKDEKNYFKFIGTYYDLTTYISAPNIDASVFDNNYIICIKENFYLSNGWEKYYKLLGYSNFKFTDNGYEISKNCYFSVEYDGQHLDILNPVTIVNYLIVPKTEINFVEGVHEIAVNDNQINGDNGLWTNDFLGGNQNPMPPSTNTHAYLTHNEDVILPKNSAAWVVEKGSELEEQLGLEANSYSEQNYRVILYLPNEPKYDFIITEKVIKNGNLYITIEEYSQFTNEYLNKNDVKFYDLYIQDTSELADDFDVYLSIKR